MSKAFWWENQSEKSLLQIPLRELGLSLKNSPLQASIKQLYAELRAKGLKFRPHVWIADEWFAADGVTGIAIPFYLLHPRLARLEKKMMLEIEGGTPHECLKLLRHEAGHALDNAFHLRKRRRRQALFGLSSTPYPDTYVPKAKSENFVTHLNPWYAQSHPDEDWAETFAVWLNPKSNWQVHYAQWPALQKLKLVDEIMTSLRGREPVQLNFACPGSIEESQLTLAEYYQSRRETLQVKAHIPVNPHLLQLFSNEPRFRKRQSAAGFLHQERARIVETVARWTGQYRLTVDLLVSQTIETCEEQNLFLTQPEHLARFDVVSLLTSQTLQAMRGGQARIHM